MDILTPFGLGLKDSVNPYVAATGVVLLWLLAREGYTARRIKRTGMAFLQAFGVIVAVNMLGVWDRWMQAASVQRALWGLSLGIAVVFLWSGLTIFWEWWKGAFRPSEKNGTGRIPAFLQRDENTEVQALEGQEKRQKRFGIIVVSVILGVLGALWNSLWPPDYYVYWASARSVSGGNPGLATLFFVLYSLGYMSFLVVVWLAVLFVHRSHAAVRLLLQKISVIRAASSAACLAIGAGLIYVSVFIGP